MYTGLLALHSVLRWVVILLGIWAVVRALSRGSRPWLPADDAAGQWFGTSLDVQMLIGLVLYGIFSPITRMAFGNMGAAMRDPVIRFFVVEHASLMILALAFAHVGRVRVRRARVDAAKFKTAAIFYSIALLAVLLATPWPFRAVGRPLLPMV